MEQSRFWVADGRSANERIPRLLWDTKISLPCSQEPATGSYHEPDESSPHLHTLFP
jgi:hypothetical protein